MADDSGVGVPNPAVFWPDSGDGLAGAQGSWLRAVRAYLVLDEFGMDALVGLPRGTWAAVESGVAALTSRGLRPLLRRVVPLGRRPRVLRSFPRATALS